MFAVENEPAAAASCQAETSVPSIEELRERIVALSAMLKSLASSVERDRRVPMSSIEALREARYFDIVKPRAFGGLERNFSVLVDLNIDLAKSCASTAWVAGLLAAHQWLVGSFPLQAQRDVWEANPNALVCGSYAPACQALPAEGGYRISGRWSFASGCDCAQWSVCAAVLPADGERDKPAPAFLLVPASDYTIDDTWHVVGLAGTGSKTLMLDDVFDPDAEHDSLVSGVRRRRGGAGGARRLPGTHGPARHARCGGRCAKPHG